MADKLTLDRQAMKDRSTAHLRIYVGGLTESATIDNLYEHFSAYGHIKGIIVNRNFGFVQFENESSAQEAIQKANGSVFLGRNIIVRTAQSNTDATRRETEVTTVHSQIPPAVVLSDNIPVVPEEVDDQYDNYGNYVGDPGYDDEYQEEEYQGRGGRGGGHGIRGRGARGGRSRAPAPFRERSPHAPRNFDRYPLPDYPRALPVSDKNDCEIIVVSKMLTEYAEYIESRLKRLGVVVDLLFPMEDVPIGKVLGNIASRGCLYAILVMPQNQEHRSLTLTILHGLPQEHRNMPIEDALQLISRNFAEVRSGGASGREAVYALLGQLADGRSLTALQLDKLIEYLKERREQQAKIELGEPLSSSAISTSKTQTELQQRILSILNDKKKQTEPTPPPAPASTTQNKLLNDPSVRKALDSILHKLT